MTDDRARNDDPAASYDDIGSIQKTKEGWTRHVNLLRERGGGTSKEIGGRRTKESKRGGSTKSAALLGIHGVARGAASEYLLAQGNAAHGSDAD